jgi:CRP-like cAMP-binding protein
MLPENLTKLVFLASFFGEIPALSDEPVLVTMRAATDCRLYTIEADDFLKLLHECRDFERAVFRIVQQRTRGLESFIRGRVTMTLDKQIVITAYHV